MSEGRAGFGTARYSGGQFLHAMVGVLPILIAAGLTVPAALAADCKATPAASVDWQECKKNGLLLQESSLDGANLAGTDFTSTDLRGSSLAGANLEKATLIRSSLAGSMADKANFARIEGYRTVFSEVSAKGASFASAELQRADFTGADVSGADFQKAELGRANFKDATLTGTSFALSNLSRAELQDASFEGAIDLTGAFLLLTRLDGLDLTLAKGLQQWQLDQACGDANTKLPEGLKPGPQWPCKFDFD